MRRPRLLDLFCCEGGASRGYAEAGFDVIGVDIEPQPNYPFEFHQGDAMAWPLDGFDAVHASPPCQDHSNMSTGLHAKHGTAWMLPRTIDRLREWNGVWVVENVEGADMPGAVTLCGTEFGLSTRTRDGVFRVLRRHRRFLSNVWLMGAGGCTCSGRPVVGVYGHGGGGRVTRGYTGDLAESREAMGMAWGSRKGVSQAIPPAYTRFIGEQLITALGVGRA